VIDDEHPGGVPLERWGQQPAQFDPSAGTQVSKVWWDGDKLMTKPIPLESIYKEPEQPAQQEPVAWEYGDEIFWHNAPDINDHIRSTGKPLFYLDTSQPAQQEPYCYVYTENGEDFFAPPTAYVPDEATPLYKSPQSPAQQKPVAYSYTSRITGAQGFSHHPMPKFIDAESWDIKPLYTRPQAREPLTDEEIWGIAERSEDNRFSFARAIEAAHGIEYRLDGKFHRVLKRSWA